MYIVVVVAVIVVVVVVGVQRRSCHEIILLCWNAATAAAAAGRVLEDGPSDSCRQPKAAELQLRSKRNVAIFIFVAYCTSCG